jgi:hypothetical protein
MSDPSHGASECGVRIRHWQTERRTGPITTFWGSYYSAIFMPKNTVRLSPWLESPSTLAYERGSSEDQRNILKLRFTVQGIKAISYRELILIK